MATGFPSWQIIFVHYKGLLVSLARKPYVRPWLGGTDIRISNSNCLKLEHLFDPESSWANSAGIPKILHNCELNPGRTEEKRQRTEIGQTL